MVNVLHIFAMLYFLETIRDQIPQRPAKLLAR